MGSLEKLKQRLELNGRPRMVAFPMDNIIRTILAEDHLTVEEFAKQTLLLGLRAEQEGLYQIFGQRYFPIKMDTINPYPAPAETTNDFMLEIPGWMVKVIKNYSLDVYKWTRRAVSLRTMARKGGMVLYEEIEGQKTVVTFVGP